MRRLACLIPAAGAATRFGAPKQLASMGSTTLLQSVVDTAHSAFPGETFVVLGAYREEIAPRLRNARIVDHPGWRDGLGSSLAAGVAAILDHAAYDGILVALGDQAALQPEDFQALRDRFTGDEIVCARYQGKRGVPALFPARCFEALISSHGDRGAKAILTDDRGPVVTVDMPRAAVDVDVPEDLLQIPVTPSHRRQSADG